MQEFDDPKEPTAAPSGSQNPTPSEPESSLPFASPAESTGSLSFREDSANLPAPAPFQVIGQVAEASTSPPAPDPFSDQGPAESFTAEPHIAEPTSVAPANPAHSVPPLSDPIPSPPQVSAPAPPVAGMPQVETQPMETVQPAEASPTPLSAAAQPAAPLAAQPAAPLTAQPAVPQPANPTPVQETAPVQQPGTPPPYQGPNDGARRLQQAVDVMSRLQQRMRAQILGRNEVIDLVLVALLADGHVLLEDFPGSGKTTLAKSLGSSIINPPAASAPEALADGSGDGGNTEDPEDGIADFRRIQFTPDLLPSDVTGVSVFDVNTNRFDFRRGPIFAHVVLADEINRTSPKVQSAMLEAMAEKQVTVDNVTYPLDPLFFVIATQNPLDLAGTYPLPVAQLDRFLFKIRMQHIDRQAELEVLNTYRQRRDMERQDLPKVTRLDVLAARRAIDELVAIEQPVKECLVDIAHRLRSDERVLQGNSTRSLVLILPALQALAVLRGRDFVSADDIQTLIPRVLGHRVELAPGVTDMDQVLTEVMEGPIEALSRSTLRRRR